MKNIIAIDVKPDGLSDSLGRSIPTTKLEDVLDFLMIDSPDSFIVVWNLFQLVDVLRKLMPEDRYIELTEKDKVWVNHYKLFSSEGKKLSIGHEYKEYQHDNFYSSTKKEVDIYNLNRYFPNYKPTDAMDIKSKGIELLKTLDEMGMGNTPTLASGIAIYDKTIMTDLPIPHFYDMPDRAIDAMEYLMPLLSRELRACYQVGMWEQATDIDIHGAYPSLVRNLGDLSNCKIWHGKRYEHCDWGVFKGELEITGNTPIVNADKQPVVGKYTDFVTTDQWAYLNKYKRGTFKPIDGWMIKYLNDSKPLMGLMDKLYADRQAGGLKSDISKAIAVGLIGMFAQTYGDKHGAHFNPFYSVMATSRCSLKVGKFIEDNILWDNIIEIIVDGCLIDKPYEIQDTGEIGTWHSEQVKALVMSIGHSYVGTKHPDNHDYADMMLAIKTNPKAGSYNNVLLTPEIQTTNRVFEDYPRTGAELLGKIYKSKPIEVK